MFAQLFGRTARAWLTASGSGLFLLLAGCGGGDAGSFVPVIPPPPPPVGTVSSSANPLSAPPVGVTITTSFATIGSLQAARWNADLKAYEVQVGGYPSARAAVNLATGGNGQSAELIGSDGAALPLVIRADAGFDYTRLGYAATTSAEQADAGAFAFGIPTLPGGVPTSGTASYDAQLEGHAGDWALYGTALLQFDFAAGKLSGYMDPHTNGPMESPELPRYTFTQTVFSPGSTTFSGSFDIAGPTPSSFQGQFTGPNAQELMASFKAPFLDWDLNEVPNTWGVMEGVMVGKRK